MDMVGLLRTGPRWSPSPSDGSPVARARHSLSSPMTAPSRGTPILAGCRPCALIHKGERADERAPGPTVAAGPHRPGRPSRRGNRGPSPTGQGRHRAAPPPPAPAPRRTRARSASRRSGAARPRTTASSRRSPHRRRPAGTGPPARSRRPPSRRPIPGARPRATPRRQRRGELVRSCAHATAVPRGAGVCGAARPRGNLPSLTRPRRAGVPVRSRLRRRLGQGQLGISAKTVMHHTSSIYRKLGVRGRAEAVTWSLLGQAAHEAPERPRLRLVEPDV